MKSNWETRLKQQIPNIDQRITTNSQSVKQKIHSSRNNEKRTILYWLAGLGTVTLILVFSSISSLKPQDTPIQSALPSPINTQIAATIKISLPIRNSITDSYGKLIASEFPNIQQTFIDAGQIDYSNFNASREKMFAEQKPDLIVVNSIEDYERYVHEGKILNLESFIKRDKFELSDILPVAINTLKEHGNGSLYGLTPTFDNRVLFYNKNLFNQYGVPYPTDRMSWDDIMNLAKKFPSAGPIDQRIYGFHEMYMSMFSSSYLIKMIASTNELHLFNDAGTKVTMDSQAWNKAFHLAMDGYQSGLLHRPATVTMKNNRIEKTDQQAMDLFSQGKAAMTLDTVEFYNRDRGNSAKFEFGAVTPPVSPEHQDANTFLMLNPILAINASSANPDAVWEVIKYINSDEVAKAVETTNFGVTTHLSALNSLNKPDLDAFTKLNNYVNSSDVYYSNRHTSVDFNKSFDILLEAELQAVLDGKQDTDKALQNIQQKGQKLLDDSLLSK